MIAFCYGKEVKKYSGLYALCQPRTQIDSSSANEFLTVFSRGSCQPLLAWHSYSVIREKKDKSKEKRGIDQTSSIYSEKDI